MIQRLLPFVVSIIFIIKDVIFSHEKQVLIEFLLQITIEITKHLPICTYCAVTTMNVLLRVEKGTFPENEQKNMIEYLFVISIINKI